SVPDPSSSSSTPMCARPAAPPLLSATPIRTTLLLLRKAGSMPNRGTPEIAKSFVRPVVWGRSAVCPGLHLPTPHLRRKYRPYAMIRRQFVASVRLAHRWHLRWGLEEP